MRLIRRLHVHTIFRTHIYVYAALRARSGGVAGRRSADQTREWCKRRETNHSGINVITTRSERIVYLPSSPRPQSGATVYANVLLAV